MHVRLSQEEIDASTIEYDQDHRRTGRSYLQGNKIIDPEVITLQRKVQELEWTIDSLRHKLNLMSHEAITHKKALDGLLDIMSQADVFDGEPDTQEPVDTEKLVEDLRVDVLESGILWHQPIWDLRMATGLSHTGSGIRAT